MDDMVATFVRHSHPTHTEELRFMDHNLWVDALRWLRCRYPDVGSGTPLHTHISPTDGKPSGPGAYIWYRVI